MVEDSHPIHLQTISCSTDAGRFLQERISRVPSEQVCDWVHRSDRNAYPTFIIPKQDRAVRWWVAYRTCSASWIKWWDNNFIHCHWWQQRQMKMGNEPATSHVSYIGKVSLFRQRDVAVLSPQSQGALEHQSWFRNGWVMCTEWTWWRKTGHKKNVCAERDARWKKFADIYTVYRHTLRKSLIKYFLKKPNEERTW